MSIEQEICGVAWSDPTNPCEYGTTTDHVCFNSKVHCNGAHMCCDVVPPYVQEWIDAHSDPEDEWIESFDLANQFMQTDEAGNVSCGCCGVTYFTVS